MLFLPTAILAWLSVLWLAPTPPAAVGPTTVTVVVTHLPSTTATLKLYFYNEPANFLVRNHYTLLKHVKPGGQSQLTYTLPLAPGEWAIALTQDLNENDLVDRNMLGIPTEPFAFSNNVHPRFRVPTFADCQFTVSGRKTTVTISMK